MYPGVFDPAESVYHSSEPFWPTKYSAVLEHPKGTVLASIADRASIRSFSVGDWAGLNGLGGEAEELATRAYAPELLTLTLHGSGSAAFREGGQARYGFLSTLLRLPKELSLPGKRSLSNASCFQEVRRKVTQLRHGVYAALLLAKANGRQLSGHRSRGRERPRA